MKTRNIIITVSVLLNVVLGILFYNETLKKGPADVGYSFHRAVQVENYVFAKTLIDEGRQKYISDETLKKVNEIMTSGTSYKSYQLLEFDNGEMVLLNLHNNTPDSKYKIQDVVIVPDELKVAFK
jgi:hydrogenase maturation factor